MATSMTHIKRSPAQQAQAELWRIDGMVGMLKSLRKAGIITAGAELRMLKELQLSRDACKRTWELRGVKFPGINK